jgi:beta-lactamase regulating signal transducer with metallopeptidase domain
MLAELFYWLLNMSILGGFTGLIVAVLRKIPKIPKFTAYVLWLLPLIRMWIPFGLVSQWSLLSLISRFTSRTVILWEDVSVIPDISASNFIQVADGYFPISYKTDLLRTVFEVSSIVWLIGSIASILFAIALYVSAKREIRGATHLRENIWISERIDSPAVYGIFYPLIVVPTHMSEEDLPYILAHENVHVRRMDNVWRLIAIATACVHWFNPLSWIFLHWFFTDMELACDRKALHILGEDKAKSYAAVLLVYAAGKSSFISAFGATKTRHRIRSILTYKKLTVLSSLAFSVLLTTIIFVLITNATGG